MQPINHELRGWNTSYLLVLVLPVLAFGCASAGPAGDYTGRFKLPFLPEPSLSEQGVAAQLAEKQANEPTGTEETAGTVAVAQANATAPLSSESTSPRNEITTVPRIDPEEKKGLFDFDVAGMFGGQPVDEAGARRAFALAEQSFQQAAGLAGQSQSKDQFSKTAKLYQQAAEQWPFSVVEEDAMFMKAESHFFADAYSKANQSYGEMLKKYPNSRHLDQVDRRRFAIAQWWIDLDKRSTLRDALPNLFDRQRPLFDSFGHAVKTWDQIRFDNPTGQLSDDATMAGGVAQFEAAKYSDADILLTDLMVNFPLSEHQFQAHLLSLKCKQMIYEGPDYDGGGLTEGEKLIVKMYKIFPYQAEKHREYLDSEYRTIRLKKAEREHSLARYYDRRKEYGAAKHYYAAVMRDFPDTNLAVESETRIAELAGLPDTPPDRTAWLSGMFPEEDKESKPLLAPRNGTLLR